MSIENLFLTIYIQISKRTKKNMSSCCDHCNQNLDSKHGLKCALCNRQKYCNTVCAEKDWSLHQDVCNIVTVPIKEAVVAVPHGFHTVLTEKNFSSQDFDLLHQGFSIRHVAPNGTVSQRVQRPIEKSTTKNNHHLLPSETFELCVKDAAGKTRVLAKGETVRNVIHTKAPGAGGYLAKTRESPNSSQTLWVKPRASETVTVPVDQVVTLSFMVPKLDERGMTVVLPPLQNYMTQYSELSRRARGAIEQQLQMKRLGSNVSSTQVIPMMAKNTKTGQTIRLLFYPSQSGKNASLIDVEYVLPTNISSDASSVKWHESRFHCSPSDQDAVQGLILAISERIDQGNDALNYHKEHIGLIKDDPDMQKLADQLEGLQSDYAVIADHYNKLFVEQNPSYTEATPQVRSAMYRLQQEQFQEIGAFTNPVSLARKGFRELRTLTKRWVDEYNKRQDQLENMGEKKRLGDEGFTLRDSFKRRVLRRQINNTRNKLKVMRAALLLVLKGKKKKGRIAGATLTEEQRAIVKGMRQRINEVLKGFKTYSGAEVIDNASDENGTGVDVYTN